MSGGGMGQFEPLIRGVMNTQGYGQMPQPSNRVTNFTPSTTQASPYPQMPSYGSPFGGGYGGYGSPFGGGYGGYGGMGGYGGYGSPFGGGYGSPFGGYGSPFGGQNYNAHAQGFGQPQPKIANQTPTTDLGPDTTMYNAMGAQQMQTANAAGGQLMQQQRESANQRQYAGVQQLESLKKQVADLQAQLQGRELQQWERN